MRDSQDVRQEQEQAQLEQKQQEKDHKQQQQEQREQEFETLLKVNSCGVTESLNCRSEIACEVSNVIQNFELQCIFVPAL